MLSTIRIPHPQITSVTDWHVANNVYSSDLKAYFLLKNNNNKIKNPTQKETCQKVISWSLCEQTVYVIPVHSNTDKFKSCKPGM